MSELIMPPELSTSGVCAQVDHELWFPDKGGSTREAKAICNGDPRRGTAPCPVRDQCLDWALNTGEHFGIWGGKSERERRNLRAKRAAA